VKYKPRGQKNFERIDSQERRDSYVNHEKSLNVEWVYIRVNASIVEFIECNSNAKNCDDEGYETGCLEV
jgi:hypothetical protein